MTDALALYGLFLLLTSAIYLTAAFSTPRYDGRGIPMAGLSVMSAALIISMIKLCLM